MRKLLLLIGCLLALCWNVSGQAGNYRTIASGNWGTPATWERDVNANGIYGEVGTDENPSTVAPNTNTTAGTIQIRNTHTVTVAANVIVDGVTIDTGGLLLINSGITLTLGATNAADKITVNGDLTNNGVIDFGALSSRVIRVYGHFNNNASADAANQGFNKLIFESGSNYYHLFADAGQVTRATWNTGSTLNVVGYTSGNTTPPTQIDIQAFHNFVWNSPGQDQIIDLGGNPSSISGNFQIDDTGSGALVFNYSGSGNNALSVGGDLISNGGTFGFVLSTGSPGTLDLVNTTSDILISSGGYVIFANTDNVTITCGGNFAVASGGTIDFSSSTAVTQLDLFGNYTDNGGVYINGAASNINFKGSTLQTFTSTTTPGGILNYTIGSGSKVSIAPTSFIGGSGSLTVQASGELYVNSTHTSGAIQNGNATGSNIRIGTLKRTYANGAKVVYSGTSGPQFLGNGNPSATGVTTEITNTSGVSISSAISSATVGTLALTGGNLTVGASKTLAISGVISGTNLISVTSTSSLVINGSTLTGSLPLTGSTTLFNFTLNRPSGGSVTLNSDLTIAGTLTQTDGDIILNGKVLTINSDFNRTAGSIVGDTAASLIITGTGALPATFSPSGGSLGTFTLNRSAATLGMSGTLTVTNLNLSDGTLSNTGTLTMSSAGVITRVSGSLTGNAPVASPSYDVVYNNGSSYATGVELPSGTTQLKNLTKTLSGTLTLGSAITVNGALTLSSGLFDSNGNAIDLKGNFVSNASATLTGSTVSFSGTTVLSGSSTPVFGGMLITGTLTTSINYQVNGNLNLSGGTLNNGSVTTTFGGSPSSITGSPVFNNIIISGTLTSPGTFSVNGTWTNNGTFTAGSGTVAFGGTTTIGGSSTTNFNSIQITGTLTSPTTLNVAGNFTNSGTFNNNGGTVVFNGTATQSISGSTITNFNNISVTNTAGPPAVQIQSDQNLRGVLTLAASSIFDADGSGNASVFTLVSTADNPTVDASIATLPAGASVQGSVTVQRFMALEGNNSNRIYRFISSPVQGAPVSQFQAFIPVTGSFSGADTGCSGCGSSQSMFSYDESVIIDSNNNSVAGDANDGFINFPLASNTETFASGKGYTVYVRGNVIGSAAWSLRGAVNSGNVVLPVSFTSTGVVANDGWNLVGNPYPSTIDWDAAGWTRSNLNNTTYMLDNGLASPVYATHVAGGASANGGSRYIATGQAFYVKSDGGSPSLIAAESVKAAGTQTTFFRQATVNDVMRITLRQGLRADESVIQFSASATRDFDSQLDAHKLNNPAPMFSLATLGSGNTRYVINSIPFVAPKTEVPLDIVSVTPGNYSLDFSEFESFQNASLKITLYDAFLGNEVDIRTSPSYSFSVSSDIKSFGAGRFTVVFGEDAVTGLEPGMGSHISIYPVPTNNKLNVEVNSANEVSARIVTITGAILMDQELRGSANTKKGVFNLEDQAEGLYLLIVRDGTKFYQTRIIKKR
jgi:hypothetical protein